MRRGLPLRPSLTLSVGKLDCDLEKRTRSRNLKFVLLENRVIGKRKDVCTFIRVVG